jgi:hypothetical protein
VPFVCGDRSEIIIALDWPDFHHGGHSNRAASLVNVSREGSRINALRVKMSFFND